MKSARSRSGVVQKQRSSFTLLLLSFIIIIAGISYFLLSKQYPVDGAETYFLTKKKLLQNQSFQSLRTPTITNSTFPNNSSQPTYKRPFLKNSAREAKSTPRNQPNITAIEFNLLRHINELKALVKEIRSKKVVMPVDPIAINLTTTLQNVTRCYLLSRYGGQNRYIISMELKFPKVMLDSIQQLQYWTSNTSVLTVFVELAPLTLLPHSFHTVCNILSFSMILGQLCLYR